MGPRGVLDRLSRLVAGLRRKGFRGAARAALVRLHDRAGGATREETGELRGRLRALEAELGRLRVEADGQAASLRALGHAALEPPAAVDPAWLADGPLVSVILPVRDQAATLPEAIESVRRQSYPRWELLIVDDGSADRTPDVLAQHGDDPRFTILRQEARGVAAARNRALAVARGAIIAYLDADNLWASDHLARVVAALRANPDRSCAYLAQLVLRADGRAEVRFEPWDRERQRRQSCIDLGVFAHRRSLYEKLGGFDESLTRLVDWDLIGRYCEEDPPVAVPALGGIYRDHAGDRISTREPLWHNAWRVQRKLERPIAEPLRVLYLLWHYPQLSESYVRWEMEYMRRRGVEVEVWTELPAAPAPFPTDVRIHRGRVEDAIASFRPHVAHVHWLNVVPKVRDALARAGVPLTARGHNFDFKPKFVRPLLDDPVVRRVYLYPHFAAQLDPAPKVAALRPAIPGELYPPARDKDPRLVVRCGAGLPFKDFETFFAVAERCPEHRFVLVVARATEHEGYPDELVARARGTRVEVRVDLQAEEVARLVARAGIFLHTSEPGSTVGMPTGICEALATGCWVLARRSPGAEALLSGVGALYGSVDDAAERIRRTASWPPSRWQEVQRAASERGFRNHADTRVCPRILDDWLAIARGRVFHGDETPPLDERFRPLLDWFFELGFDRLRHHDGALTEHQIGVGRGLLAWGADSEVCLAGMAHSLYGTERGGTGFDPRRRDELRARIGARAERLVHANCALERSSLDAALAAPAGPRRLRDRRTGEELLLDEADFGDLCRIHLCDWLEQVARCGRWSERRAAYRKLALRLGGEALASFDRVYALEAPSASRVASSASASAPGAPSTAPA